MLFCAPAPHAKALPHPPSPQTVIVILLSESMCRFHLISTSPDGSLSPITSRFT